MEKRYVFAMAGASGQIFGLRVLRELVRSGAEVHIVASPNALEMLAEECDTHWRADTVERTRQNVQATFPSAPVYYWDSGDLAAPVASGSFKTDGMMVVPCSVKTLAGIAHGYAGTLIERAADVTIKEGRKLLLSPREMPFSAIHLQNMLDLARLGVVIAPPVPAFYHGVGDMEGAVDFVAGKILDAFSVQHELFKRWQGRV